MAGDAGARRGRPSARRPNRVPEESWPLKHWLSLHANDLRATLAEANAVLTSCAAADCDPSLESAARAMAGFAGRFHEAIVAQLSVRC